jgi:hypothetical protein
MFVDLCRNGKFKKAYVYYNEKDKIGDFIVCLKHSTPRYHFYTEVISPMIFEFEQRDSASVKYHYLLKLEFYLEEFTMQYGAGDSDYIPETFPLISNDLAVFLASLRNVDEALEIIDDYAYALNGIYGNPAYTNLCVAFFTASIYTNANDSDNAKKTLEKYIEYTSEHKDPGRDPSEYEYYISLVNRSLQEMDNIK